MNDVFSRAVVRDHQGRKANRPAPLAPVVAFSLASLFGGSLAGAALGAVGVALASSGIRGIGVWGAIVIAVLAVGLQWAGRVSPLPQRRKQVPRRWLLWRRRTLTGVAYGLMLGVGFLTFLQFAAMYVLAALAVLTGSVLSGAAVGALYGGLRPLPLLITWFSDVHLGRRPDWEQLLVRKRDVCRTLAIAGAATLAGATAIQPFY